MNSFLSFAFFLGAGNGAESFLQLETAPERKVQNEQQRHRRKASAVQRRLLVKFWMGTRGQSHNGGNKDGPPSGPSVAKEVLQSPGTLVESEHHPKDTNRSATATTL